MKKNFTLWMGMLWSMIIYSQNLDTKVPPNAFFVSEIKMENLSKKYTMKELEHYTFMQREILPDLKEESLNNIGIDYQKSSIVYAISEEGTTQVVSLMPLQDAVKFKNYILRNHKKEVYEAENYAKIDLGAESLAWNDQFVAFIKTDRSYSIGFTDEEIEEEYKKMKQEEAEERGEVYEEEGEPYLDWNDKYEVKSRLRRKASDKVEENRIEQIFSNQQFNTRTYFQERNPEADFYVYLNYDGYQNMIFSLLGKGTSNWNMKGSQYDVACNAFFEEKQLKVVTEVIPNDEISKNFLKKIYGSKIQSSLLNYVGTEPIAYTSFSSDTKAALDQYYDVLKSYVGNMAKIQRDDVITQEHINLLIDGIALLIDEEAIAELFTGDGIFILDDLTEREVEYTSYRYDEEYNRVEEIKTKNEIVPEFTFLFSTENEKFMERLLKIPNIKSKGRLPYTYNMTGKIHHIKFKEEYIEELYTAVNNGMVMITTSGDKIRAFDQNHKMAINKSDKKIIKKNSMAAKFDMKRLLNAVEGEFKTSKDKKLWKGLVDNVGEYTITGKIEGDRLVSEALFGIEGEHKNSLLYLFDMIDYIYQNEKREHVQTVEAVDAVEEAVQYEAAVEAVSEAVEAAVEEAATAVEEPVLVESVEYEEVVEVASEAVEEAAEAVGDSVEYEELPAPPPPAPVYHAPKKEPMQE